MGAIVLIADIVGSRDIPERRAFQQTLADALAAVSKTSGQNLLSPYTITLGDEFQAVYASWSDVFRDVVTILWKCHPQKIRFSLNEGAIATDINPQAALGMDGPAFHGARAAIDEAKKLAETVIVARRSGKPVSAVVDAALRVLGFYVGGLSATAIGALALYARGADLATMVEQTGVKERAVYKAMATHHVREHWQLFHEVERAITARAEREEEPT